MDPCKQTNSPDQRRHVSLKEVTLFRRSGRSRTSTTMKIDGYTVLRKNNYEVNGMNYIYDAHQEDIVDNKKKNPRKKLKLSHSGTNHRKPSVAQIERSKHNKTVVSATRIKQDLQLAFFTKNIKLLQPFCEPAVLERFCANTKKPAKELDTFSVAPPKMIDATLRDYQLRGLNFMVHMHRQNLAMILGDEMGLGKTLQTISFLCYLKEQEKVQGPSLVICPLSVLTSWCNEMKKWSPTLRFFRLHASDREEQDRQKQVLLNSATEYDVILTTYEMAKAPGLVSFYHRLHFNYLILDEAHKIKGHLTQLAVAIRKIHKGNTLLLTGTPLQNNLVELWALLNFLYPTIFTTLIPFQTHFDLTANKVDRIFLVNTQKLLQLFMLRRLKIEVEKLMPKKLETKVYCPLSKTQIFWYKSLLMKDMGRLASIEDASELGASRHQLLRSLFMQLRKCCNHPYLFKGSEIDPDETSLRELVAASGKLSVLDMLLQSLFNKKNRAVIFSQFTMVLDIIQDYCILRGWKYVRLDGSVSRARRNYFINRFNEPNSPYFLFLISTKSGGMGLNLQTADTCILFDSDWNPQNDIQAMGRVHRIGQKKTVHVYRLVSSGTIEERMLERAEKKLLLEMVNKESNETASSVEAARGLSVTELLEDIKFGCEGVFGNSTNKKLPSWEDIDFITDRSRVESDCAGELKGGVKLSARTFDAEKDFSATQYFGGADFREIRKKQAAEEKKKIPQNLQGIAHLWKTIQSLEKKRVKKSRIVLLNGMGSGYGSASVPVLASNNYDLLHGESSVFDRELSNFKKSNCEVKNKKKKNGAECHQEHCQVCGEGGDLLFCSFCPCSFHSSCHLKKSVFMQKCTHHHCSKCFKNRSAAGGMLLLCECCPNAYCEDCLPKKGVKYLEKVDRFEKLGFDSTKMNMYIHCSPQCENYAERHYGYTPSKDQTRCPVQLDLSYNYGGSYELNAEMTEVEEEKKEGIRTTRTRGGKSIGSTSNLGRNDIPLDLVADQKALSGNISSTAISISDSSGNSTMKNPLPSTTVNRDEIISISDSSDNNDSIGCVSS